MENSGTSRFLGESGLHICCSSVWPRWAMRDKKEMNPFVRKSGDGWQVARWGLDLWFSPAKHGNEAGRISGFVTLTIDHRSASLLSTMVWRGNKRLVRKKPEWHGRLFSLDCQGTTWPLVAAEGIGGGGEAMGTTSNTQCFDSRFMIVSSLRSCTYGGT